jgi:hypothetical protein
MGGVAIEDSWSWSGERGNHEALPLTLKQARVRATCGRSILSGLQGAEHVACTCFYSC